MEKIEDRSKWYSDFDEIDDVLDKAFFATIEEMEDTEDDDFHEGEPYLNPISEL